MGDLFFSCLTSSSISVVQCLSVGRLQEIQPLAVRQEPRQNWRAWNQKGQLEWKRASSCLLRASSLWPTKGLPPQTKVSEACGFVMSRFMSCWVCAPNALLSFSLLECLPTSSLGGHLYTHISHLFFLSCTPVLQRWGVNCISLGTKEVMGDDHKLLTFLSFSCFFSWALWLLCDSLGMLSLLILICHHLLLVKCRSILSPPHNYSSCVSGWLWQVMCTRTWLWCCMCVVWSILPVPLVIPVSLFSFWARLLLCGLDFPGTGYVK